MLKQEPPAKSKCEDDPIDERLEVLLWNRTKVAAECGAGKSVPRTVFISSRNEAYQVALATSIRMYLERAVIDDARGLDHILWLEELAEQGHATLLANPISQWEFDRVVCEGLGGLPLPALTRLAIAPLALDSLKDSIREGDNPAWDEVALRLVREDVIRGRVKLPTARGIPDLTRNREPVSEIGAEESVLPAVATVKPEPLPQSQVYRLFRERMGVESDAASAAAGLPLGIRLNLADKLQRIADHASVCEGDAFVDDDVKFHTALCEAVKERAVDPLWEGCRFVYDHADRSALDGPLRETIGGEHDRVIDAIRRGDSNAAFEAMRSHLVAARNRWLPNFLRETARKGMAIFERMALGGVVDALCVSSVTVTPLEMHEQFTASVGRAAAEAVGRGAVLIYLRPSAEVLAHWVGLGLKDLQLTVEEIGDEFDAYRRMIVGVLADMGCYGGHEEVTAMVERRVFLFLCDSEDLFLLTRPSQTLGYYRHPDGREVMSHRETLSETEASPDILLDSPSTLETALFRVKVREALLGVAAKDCLDAGLAETAQSLADQWFAPPKRPVVLV